MFREKQAALASCDYPGCNKSQSVTNIHFYRVTVIEILEHIFEWKVMPVNKNGMREVFCPGHAA